MEPMEPPLDPASGGFRNLERRFQCEVWPKILGCLAHFRHVNAFMTHVIIVVAS